jgi:hypothetical protein
MVAVRLWSRNAEPGAAPKASQAELVSASLFGF